MSESLVPAGRLLQIEVDSAYGKQVLKALASEPRLRVLDLLRDRVRNVSEIALALDMPPSTTTLHIAILEEAGLLKTELQPAVRGLQKVCARVYDVVQVRLSYERAPLDQMIEVAMPLGSYVDCQVAPTCGLASETGIIGLFDDPASFYEPQRADAQLIWFRKGFVEYRFPNRLPSTATLDSLHLSLELCSEAPLHHDDWPSDVTLWINGLEIGTWTSPADLGGQRGVLTPEWWEDWNSQYGFLKVWQVNGTGSFVDGLKLSTVQLADLRIPERPFISARLGIKPDARHIGGLNLFGRHFGNYPQDIVLRLRYH